MSIRDSALHDMERRRAEAAVEADRLRKDVLRLESELLTFRLADSKLRFDLATARQEIADLRGLTLWRLLKMWWRSE